MYFNVNFNVFFKIKNVKLLASVLYVHQTARCNNKKNLPKYLPNLKRPTHHGHFKCAYELGLWKTEV